MNKDAKQTESSEEASLSQGRKKEKEKDKKLGTNRGIETLFRNVYRVHVEVSALADSKANFLISVNSIIMILTVSHGLNYVTEKALFLPIGIVMASSIGSMIFAVLVARPRIGEQSIPKSEVRSGSSNLLFFGSFTKLSREEFIEEMTATISDSDALYSSMMTNIYEMGLVLERKFGQLKIAYNFLLIGTPLGLVLFLLIEGIILARGM